MGLRATRFLVLLALITLLGFQSVASQSSDWVERTVVTQYVKNLLDTYNSLVNLYYGYYPDSHVLDRFRLYHAVGYSFNVTVMRFNSTTTAFVAFIFVPIMSASPLIIIDNNDTFIHFQYPNLPESMEPAMSALLKPNNTLGFEQVQGTSVGPNGTRLAQRIWVANATTMFANIMTSSADAANYIFKSDQAGYNQDLARAQTTTSSELTSTQFQTSSSTTSNGSDQWIMLTVTGIIGTVVGGLILTLIMRHTHMEKDSKLAKKMKRRLLRRKKQKVEQPKQDEVQDKTPSEDVEHSI